MTHPQNPDWLIYGWGLGSKLYQVEKGIGQCEGWSILSTNTYLEQHFKSAQMGTAQHQQGWVPNRHFSFVD